MSTSHYWKNHNLTLWTFVSKVMSLHFNILSWFFRVLLPRSKCLLISWLQSLSARIKAKAKVAQLWPALCNHMDYYSPRNYPDQNTGVGSLSLLQGIFPTQSSQPRNWTGVSCIAGGFLEPPPDKIYHYFHFFPLYLPWSDGTGCQDLSFLSVELGFSLSSFTLIKMLFSSSLLSAIRVVSSAYLMLLMFLLALLIPAYDPFSPAFHWCTLHMS